MRVLAFLTAAVLLPGLAGARDLPASGSATLRVTERTYDTLDRLETETVALEDGGLATVRYSYYDDGRRRTVTDAFGRVTFYEYDGRGNLKRVTANQGLPDQHVTTYGYWPDNLLRSITRPNGTVTTYGYDRADRLTSVFVRLGSSVLASYEYTYDANGNRLTQVETNGGGPETTTYTYDDLNRLSTVAYPDRRAFAYEYDAVGNRTRETVRNASGTVVSDKVAAFDAINRLSSITDAVDPSQNATFAYDRNGNLRSKTTPTGTESYDYDARDLMAETRTGAAITSRHAYDPFGRRYVKVGLEAVRQYVYDETSTLHELDGDDLEVAKYEYGGDSLLSFVRRDEARRFYHLDGLGSAVALSDAGGSVVARYHIDAWGRYRVPAELDASRNRFGFTGYLFDQETDLYYAKARFYDPEVGRFTSQDSVLGQVDEPPSLNRYFYGNANPLGFIDPTGHQTVGAEFCRAYACDSSVRYAVDPVSRATEPFNEALEKANDRAGFFAATAVTYTWNSTLGNAGHGASPDAGAPYPEPRDDVEAWLGVAAILTVDTAPALLPASRRLAGRPRSAPAELGPSQARRAPIAKTVLEDLNQAPVGHADPPGTAGGRQAIPGDSQAAVLDTKTASAGTPREIEVLSGSKVEHLNASIAEIHGYDSLIERGYVGLLEPGKTTAKGPDAAAFDPGALEIVAQDAKYRGPGGTYPSRIPVKTIERWKPHIKAGIDEMPPGPMKDAAMRAFEEGRIRGEVFKWPQ